MALYTCSDATSAQKTIHLLHLLCVSHNLPINTRQNHIAMLSQRLDDCVVRLLCPMTEAQSDFFSITGLATAGLTDDPNLLLH